jgi:hypothetical protein
MSRDKVVTNRVGAGWSRLGFAFCLPWNEGFLSVGLEAEAFMNPFATDHPLVSQPSWFDPETFPWRSWLCSALVLALISTPLLFGYNFYADVSEAFDIGSATDPFPQSWEEWASGIGGTFTVCLVGTLLIVGTYRVALCRSKNRRSTIDDSR